MARGWPALLENVRSVAEESRSKSQDDFDSFPPILGYNQTIPKENCDVLLSIKETGDPLVAVGKFGRGNVLAYMSDPAPHWGCNFVQWDEYQSFWVGAFDHLLTIS